MTASEQDLGKEFLEHYGVKGMKWGVRRTDAQLSRGKGKDKEDGGGAKPKKVVGKTKTTGKSASEMSDAQLKKVVERINTEQRYAQLTAPKPGVASAVGKFAAEIAVNVARTQITAVANKQAAGIIGELMAKKSKPVALRIPPPPNRFPNAPPNPFDKVG